ncbi:MAG: 4-hydroxy-tetrahydrodipicolinate synthase, partial [Bacteroidota bacterium]
MSQHTKTFRGTGVALVTPFTSNGAVDFPALKKIVEYIIKNKCEYIVVLGTTGESATLTADEKKQVIEFVSSVNKKRIPLMLGVGGNDTQELVHQLKKYSFKGYDAILSVSPYYNKPTQEGIYQHYKALSKASPLPIVLYNVPARTSSNITAETTLRLASDFKNIIAIKEASGNFDQCMNIIKSKPKDFLVISGDDNITLPLIATGADGVISVVANAYPGKFSTMVRTALSGDFVKARKLHYDILDLIPLIFSEGNPAGIKS